VARRSWHVGGMLVACRGVEVYRCTCVRVCVRDGSLLLLIRGDDVSVARGADRPFLGSDRQLGTRVVRARALLLSDAKRTLPRVCSFNDGGQQCGGVY
jgi:hypothetical protein